MRIKQYRYLRRNAESKEYTTDTTELTVYAVWKVD